MTRQTPTRSLPARGVRTVGFVLTAMLLVILALFVNHGAWAAPHHQTVPTVQTQTPTRVPQATSTPSPDQDNQPSPTPSPTTQGDATQPPQGEALTGVVSADRLNMRLGPGTSFGVVGVILSGETVRILERDEAGAWWRICCLTDSTIEGWVSAQYIRPNFNLADANTLIPVVGSAPTETSPAPVSSSATLTSTIISPSLSLELIINQTPPFVWQGQEFLLEFEVTNPGSAPATDVDLRNELPAEFAFISIEAGAEGVIEEEGGDQQPFIFSVRWPALDAGAVVTTTVQLRVVENVPDGAVIDNLAVVAAENVSPFTAGISIGMPPTTPPDFQ